MVRLALATYLSLVTAAGPWFCCCIGLRLLAHLVPPAKAPVTEAAPPAHSCCQHSPPAETPQPAPAEQPSDHPRDPDCPCRQHQDKVAAVPPGHAAAQDLLLPDHL